MIYLIDDDYSVRRGFKMLLESAGLDIISFNTIEDFLSDARPQSKDLLILDLHLPGMNGCELLSKLKEDGIYLPVIVVTAFDEPQSREACRQYGVKAFMRKPVDSEALLDIITYSLPSSAQIKTDKIAKNNIN